MCTVHSFSNANHPLVTSTIKTHHHHLPIKRYAKYSPHHIATITRLHTVTAQPYATEEYDRPIQVVVCSRHTETHEDSVRMKPRHFELNAKMLPFPGKL